MAMAVWRSSRASARLDDLLGDLLVVKLGRLRASSEHHGLHRVENDAQIEERRHAFDVEEVEPHLLDLFVQAVGVAIADLGPAGGARTDRAADRVVRDVLAEQGEIADRMRPRHDQVHVAAQDVDELRQLVEPEPAQPVADAGDSILILPDPLRVRPGGDAHGAELDQPERSAQAADPVLDEQRRTVRVELDDHGDGRHERGRHHEPDGRHHHADSACDGEVGRRLPVPGIEDQRARHQGLERHPPGQVLVDLGGFLDADAAGLGLEERPHWQPAAAIGPSTGTPNTLASPTTRSSTMPRIVRPSFGRFLASRTRSATRSLEPTMMTRLRNRWRITVYVAPRNGISTPTMIRTLETNGPLAMLRSGSAMYENAVRMNMTPSDSASRNRNISKSRTI